jgi:hypothetical protein
MTLRWGLPGEEGAREKGGKGRDEVCLGERSLSEIDL